VGGGGGGGVTDPLRRGSPLCPANRYSIDTM